MTDLYQTRIAAADSAYEDFQFDGNSVPEAANGWEDDGFGNFTRVIFVPDADAPGADTLKGQFNVSFEAGSVIPDQVWATLDGNDIGQRPSPAASVPKL